MEPEAMEAVDRAAHGGHRDPDVLDFSANVNPETPPGVREVYTSALASSRRYPPEPPTEFRAAAADSLAVDPEAVVPTAGGMAAIRLAVEATVEAGDSVVVPAPGFAEYAREVALQGGDPTFVAPDRLTAVDPAGHALVVVCNPHNPTGRAYDRSDLRALAERCRDEGAVLLVDEAFLEFTARPSMAGTPGVVVARSLTKLYGLPGLRVGFAVATGALGDAMEGGRPPWNLGTPALSVGTHCLGRADFVAATRERVASERARMRSRLATTVDVHPSEAPFLLLDVGDREVATLLERVAAAGIAIRDATTFRGLDSHVRVAVRRPAENDRLLEALADV